MKQDSRDIESRMQSASVYELEMYIYKKFCY